MGTVGSSVFGAGTLQGTKSQHISASLIITICFLQVPQLFRSDILNCWTVPLKLIYQVTKFSSVIMEVLLSSSLDDFDI